MTTRFAEDDAAKSWEICRCQKCNRWITLREILDLKVTKIDDSRWRHSKIYCWQCGDKLYATDK